ncbi:MAG: hypothetical protein L0338_10070 [Acidobacteria bacterium]|nr:hypothetical protein [Acidobacteriota bacterium]
MPGKCAKTLIPAIIACILHYGEIKPKQTVSRRGAILFGDTIQDVVKQFKREKISPYLGPPGGQ